MYRTAAATVIICVALIATTRAELRVGAAKVDVTPDNLPVLVNGGMISKSVDQITTRIHARAIVMDDGSERIGIVVVDSCMIPKQLCDEAKQLAAARTGIKHDRMLISATHTHTAPSSMGALGTDADPNYVPLLRQKLAEAFAAAEANLQPARVGWGAGQAPQFTALRRWVRRPDRIAKDPFGNLTVRASMHAARNPDDAIGPTGPEDPELSLIAFQSLDGEPICVLANFSMHYFGHKAISADYFGLFCDGFESYLAGDDAELDVVAIMSHGCSGDIWRRDYMQPQPAAEGTIEQYSQGLLEIATGVYDSVTYQNNADLAMAEARLPMRYRVPDAQRLDWARGVVEALGDRLPKTQPEIYAREQIYLHEMLTTEIVTQAIRIGNIAISTTPNETYALTGLKLKLQSPLENTMVIELANGGDGYIPPPEQHFVGGYNTWAARSAGLEISAEPRIVATNLRLLEKVCGKPRRKYVEATAAATKRILDARPIAFWRLDELSRNAAKDASGSNHSAAYEPGVLFFLDGPTIDLSNARHQTNRCVHFAGGRLRAELPELGDIYTVVLSFWNGMPLDARDVTGWMLSRDYGNSLGPGGLHLGLERSGKLILQDGNADPVIGDATIDRWTWTQVALVRTSDRIRVYLDGRAAPEIDCAIMGSATPAIASWFFGGRSDNGSNWEGKLDEIAVFDRILSDQELQAILGRQ